MSRKRAYQEEIPEASSSTSIVPCTAVPPKPSKRKKVAKDGPVEEKRLGRWRSSCPKNIQDRIDRVYAQRFFLVDRERNGEELREVFKVLGSTGNVYKVIIDRLPSCDCPDASRGNHCKHLLFVFLKVLNIPRFSQLYYQKALLTTELDEIFKIAKPNPTVNAPIAVKDAYGAASGKPSTSKAATDNAGPSTGPKHKNPEGDDCAICYEGMEGTDEELEKQLTWCPQCENAVHNECFNQWCQTAKSKGQEVTCVYCRGLWPKNTLPGSSGGASGSGLDREEGYLNLGSLAGMSSVRDDSTYYHGPRRGQRGWGGGRYGSQLMPWELY